MLEVGTITAPNFECQRCEFQNCTSIPREWWISRFQTFRLRPPKLISRTLCLQGAGVCAADRVGHRKGYEEHPSYERHQRCSCPRQQHRWPRHYRRCVAGLGPHRRRSDVRPHDFRGFSSRGLAVCLATCWQPNRGFHGSPDFPLVHFFIVGVISKSPVGNAVTTATLPSRLSPCFLLGAMRISILNDFRICKR